MLNDLSGWVRRVLAAQVAPPGLVLGLALASSVVGPPSAAALLVVVVLVGATPLVWVVVVVASLRRRDRRLRTRVTDATRELTDGLVLGVPAAGRTVRRTRARAGRPEVLVCTGLAPDGPRRVAVLAPCRVPVGGAPVALLLHPVEQEAAVLAAGVGPADLAAVAADPRWATTRPPTDLSVVGGLAGLLAAAVFGLVVGAGVSLLVVALVG